MLTALSATQEADHNVRFNSINESREATVIAGLALEIGWKL